jgi:hypothetical protein
MLQRGNAAWTLQRPRHSRSLINSETGWPGHPEPSNLCALSAKDAGASDTVPTPERGNHRGFPRPRRTALTSACVHAAPHTRLHRGLFHASIEAGKPLKISRKTIERRIVPMLQRGNATWTLQRPRHSRSLINSETGWPGHPEPSCAPAQCRTLERPTQFPRRSVGTIEVIRDRADHTNTARAQAGLLQPAQRS